jgi:signal transduction histidine kinase
MFTWGVLAALNVATVDFTYAQLQIISSAITIATETLAAVIIVRKRIFENFEFSKDLQIFTILGFALLLIIYSRVNDIIDLLRAEDWVDMRNYYLFPLGTAALTIPLTLILLNSVRKKQDKVAKFEMESYYRDMELKSLDSFNEVYGELQILRHDFHNHVLALRQISEENKDKKLIEYLALIDPIYMRASTIVQTSDRTFDAILNAKTVYAAGNGIKMNLSITLPERLPFDAIEAASLLGNLLDNAMEACERVKEKTPSAPLFINVNIAPQSGHLCIKIDNTAFAPKLRRKRYLTSKDNRKYGFGMEQIDRIVNLHGGRIYRKFEDETFSTTIFIPLPQSESAALPDENAQKAGGAEVAVTATSSSYSPLS